MELLGADDVGELLHGGVGLATRLLAQQPPGHAAHQDVQVLATVPEDEGKCFEGSNEIGTVIAF